MTVLMNQHFKIALVKIHPFKPQITKATKKLLVGTLPPEGVTFYFSNSSNTRLWDILQAISENQPFVQTGGNDLSDREKIQILDRLEIGISDVIYGYDRDEFSSTKDKHIVPKEYNELLELAIENGITELLFVYQSAYKWFLHSLQSQIPVGLTRLKTKHQIGAQPSIEYNGKQIKCILLPSPLNRGRKGESLDFKLSFYRKHILPKESITKT
jgi:G:T/U-mismatch repair DNA glycosylase